jgi:hypothetical protein
MVLLMMADLPAAAGGRACPAGPRRRAMVAPLPGALGIIDAVTRLPGRIMERGVFS